MIELIVVLTALMVWAMLNVPKNLSDFTLPIAHAQELATTTLQQKAQLVALANGLDADHFIKTIDCESGFDPLAVGDHGLSHGLVQIYEPAHPNITLEQAYDPVFSLQYMAIAWGQGQEDQWTCYRQLAASGWGP